MKNQKFPQSHERTQMKIIAVLFCFALFFPSFITNAQNNYDQLISKGLNLSYNTSFDDAEKVFNDAIKIEPNNPEGYYNIAQIHLWEYLGTHSKESYNSFMSWYKRTTDLTEKILDSKPNDYYLTYLIANTYMFKAIAAVTDHSYLNAFFAIKTSSSYFNKTLQLNPKFYDAYRGVGEIHYFMDFIPGVIKWAVNLTGLEANKDKGLAELKIAYNKGTIDKVKTTLSLAEIYSDYIAEYDSAETLLKELVSKYPNNSMFNYHLAVVLIKKRDLSGANKYLDMVLRENHPELTVLNNFSLFLKGDIYFKLNDFANSIKYNELFLSKTSDKDYTGIANYRLAVCYKILRNNEKAQECLVKVQNGNHDIYDDAFAQKMSEIYLQNGISPDELLTIKMKNNLEAGKNEEVYSTLEPMINQIRNNGTHSKALVILSEAAIQIGKYSQGISFAKQCDSVDPETESWVKPQAWYLIALENYKVGNLNDAKNYLKKVIDSDEYKNNKLLNASVNKLMKTLNK